MSSEASGPGGLSRSDPPEALVSRMVEEAGLGIYELPASVDASRTDLAQRFLDQPRGRHDEELTLLLGRMRSDLDLPRIVVTRTGSGRYALVEAPAKRGGQMRVLGTVSDLDEAERYVFRLRWRLLTGTEAPGEDPDLEPLDTLPADAIQGYVWPRSVRPGEQVAAHVSAPGPVEVSVVRVHSRDPATATPVAGLEPQTRDAEPQAVHRGSHGRVTLDGVDAGDAVTLQISCAPAGTPAERQVIAAWGDPWHGPGLALHIGPEMRPGAVARIGGEPQEVTLDAEISRWEWVTLRATVEGTRLVVEMARADGANTAEASGDAPSGSWAPPRADLVAGGVGSTQGPTGPVAASFSGRLEQLALVRGSLSPEQSALLASPGGPTPSGELASRILGWWDFSVGIDGWEMIDRGPGRRHGEWHNLPRRGVCGSRWDGVTDDWRVAPAQFAAVHLLPDALEDAGWPATYAFGVPADLRSGVYAIRVRHGEEQVELPFVVLPAPEARHPITLLLPTATYTAYSNSRFWWEDPIQEAVSDRLVEIGRGDLTLMARDELGLSHYDQHADGTDVCHVSERRPNMYLRADNAHEEGYCSDLDLIEWLDARGDEYAVVTDRDLDVDPGLLRQTEVVITGTHPEYMSASEFDSLMDWVARGGRLMYLGGNGFQTRVSFDRSRPWITENRRVDHWGGEWPGKAAEERLAYDGVSGGYFMRSGRSTLSLLGVESATMGFDESRPFERLPDLDPRTGFVFAGVDGDVVGDHGRLGGAVVGQEWDNSQTTPPPPDHHILARSTDHSMIPPMFGAARSPYHCEMTLRFSPAGGAVFSVGTMAWCAALMDGSGNDDVSTITGNVLDRFLDPAPWPEAGGA